MVVVVRISKCNIVVVVVVVVVLSKSDIVFVVEG